MSNVSKKKIKRSQIESEGTRCPYCGTLKDAEMSLGCCGESSCHFVEFYSVENDEDQYYTDEELYENFEIQESA